MIQKIVISAFLILVFSFAPGVSAAELSLQTEKPKLKLGQATTVAIVLFGGEDTLGTDVILTYDPQKLEASEVKARDLYPAYNPADGKRIDADKGKIFLSGSGGLGQSIKAKGVFAVVTFLAKSPGQTTIAFDYQVGSTTKTGIIDLTGKDLLTATPRSVTVTIQEPNIIEKTLTFFKRVVSLVRLGR